MNTASNVEKALPGGGSRMFHTDKFVSQTLDVKPCINFVENYSCYGRTNEIVEIEKSKLVLDKSQKSFERLCAITMIAVLGTSEDANSLISIIINKSEVNSSYISAIEKKKAMEAFVYLASPQMMTRFINEYLIYSDRETKYTFLEIIQQNKDLVKLINEAALPYSKVYLYEKMCRKPMEKLSNRHVSSIISLLNDDEEGIRNKTAYIIFEKATPEQLEDIKLSIAPYLDRFSMLVEENRQSEKAKAFLKHVS